MADTLTKAERSRVMSRIRGRGNKETETKLAQLFRRNGITGWRRHQKLPGTPDFVFRAARVTVFVDGCFWHQCPIHGVIPKSRRNFWFNKLGKNAARDRRVNQELRRMGWTVLRIWEHDLKSRADHCLRKVQRHIHAPAS